MIHFVVCILYFDLTLSYIFIHENKALEDDPHTDRIKNYIMTVVP